MAKKDQEVVKPICEIQICFQGTSATIYRKGASFICDTADKSVEWLVAKGYKLKDIEVVGTKPPCWDVSFPAPPVVL